MGYNNIRFDDEVTRNIFIEIFMTRMPIVGKEIHVGIYSTLCVPVLRFALKGLQWPENEDGLPSMRLEHLTKANGVAHENAHDAMSDVLATINMAKLLKAAQPRMFDYFYQLRNKTNKSTY